MKNKNSNKIKIRPEQREAMISSIKSYYENERDEALGDLAASLILDFFLEELAPGIYNQGVFDSYKYMNDRVEDLLGIQK